MTVKLLDTDGNVVDTAVTDSNGDYTFTWVTPDEYVLEIVTDENYGVSDDGLGEGSFDKDTQQTEPITVVSGEEVWWVSSWVYEEATISDTLWLDDNWNGIKDTTEAPMTWVTLNLLDTNGNIVDTAVTDSNGNYTFDEIIPGDYTVEILLEEDFGITDSEWLDGEFDADTLSTDTITLTSGDEVTDMNAWVYEEVTITDSLWLDNNGDGIKGEDEEGLAWVTLNLLDTDGNIVDTAVTDENGEYSFEEVIPGTYIIEIVPEEWFALSENEEWEIDNSLNQSEELILTSGESVPWFQIWIYEEVSISDTLWLDDNGNGIEDANEEWISWILVKLLDAEWNVSQETRTDENGEYSFDGITPGEYSIAIELPWADYHITDDSIGSGEFDSTTLTSQPMTLVSSDNVTNMDTWIYQEVTISDSVWEDSNADWIQDIGEPKLAGVVVKLLDASWEVITSTTTDSNWDYSFTGLAPWNYKVEIETPDNYNTVAQWVWSDTTIDSDIDSTTNTSDLLVVTSNETLSNVTAWFYKKVEISNTLFSDTNGNWIQDAGEIGMSWVVVNLMDSLGNIVDTSTTDENGQYTFSDVEPGDYYIEIESPTDFILAAKDAWEDETRDSDFDPETLKTDIFTVISSWDIADISAWIYKKPIVESVVFDDTNKDWIFDDTEEGLAWVSVNVYDTNGILVDTTTTSGTWEYSLELEPGTYSLEMISPLGYIISPKDSGSNDNVDSDIEETTGTTWTFTVMSSDIVDNISAWMYIPTGNISSRVFEDMNANGIQDAGETGVEWVTVNLLSADGTVYKTTTTNINWEYLFADGDYTSTASNTKSWEYTIEFTDIPTGSEFTTQNVGSDDNADSDADTTSWKTSEFTLTDQTSITNIDAGIYTDVVISDTLWLDNNWDWINNSDEVGLEGVTINLLDTDGNIVDTVVTDENGIYTFEWVTPSEYVLEIVTPDNYGVSDDGLGDGEFDATTQTTTPIVVVSGEEITWVSSGVYEEATISDTLWLDNNGDWIQGEEEVAMTWVTLHLVDVNGNIVDTVVTDENGNYTFDEIIPGDYTVEIDLPEEFGITDSEWLDGEFDADTFSTPTITLVSGQEITDMDAWVYEEVTISDTLWLDNNGDGIKGDDEVGMPWITINLLDTNWNIVDTAVTNEDGQYTFDEVVPGDYSLQIISPTNNVGVINAENWEGEFDWETQTTPIFSTISWETLSGVNAWIYEEASVWSSVWLDVNSDWNQDASEGWFAWADVNLIDNNWNIIQSVITDVNGQYLFEEVIPGEYTIEISWIPWYSVNGDFEWSDVNNTSFQSDVFLVESWVNITEGIIDAALERTSVSNSSGWSSSSWANSSSSVSNNSSASSSSSSSSSVTNSNYVSIKDTPSEAIEHTETATNTTIEVVTPHTELASETIIEKEVLQKNTIDEDTIVMTKIINWEEIEYMLKEDYDHCPIIDNLLDKTYDDNFYSSLWDIESLPNKERVMRMERTWVIDGSKAWDFENFREMSRVEFLKIVIRSHCLEYRNEDTSSLNFWDLDNSDWQAKVVKKSIDLWIANGDQDENGNPIFRADEMITKIEATKILLRMALLQLWQEPDTDYNDLIVDWHDKYVKQWEHLWVFYSEVDNYVFTPESSVTREDMVEFLYSVISLYRADEIAQLWE